MFSWGLPFWPLVIGGVIAFIVVRKHRAASCARTPSGSDWGGSTNPDAWDRWGEQAGRWGQQAGDWVNRQPWTGGGPGGGGQPDDRTEDSAAQGPAPQSPFDRPAVLGRGADGHRPECERTRRQRWRGRANRHGHSHAAGVGSARRRPLRLGSAGAGARSRAAAVQKHRDAQRRRPGDRRASRCWSAASPPAASSPAGGR